MRNMILILFVISVLSCSHDKKYYELKKENTELDMDLGMLLWKKKIIQYKGNVKKADYAYEKDKKILINDIYKTIQKKVMSNKEISPSVHGFRHKHW